MSEGAATRFLSKHWEVIPAAVAIVVSAVRPDGLRTVSVAFEPGRRYLLATPLLTAVAALVGLAISKLIREVIRLRALVSELDAAARHQRRIMIT